MRMLTWNLATVTAVCAVLGAAAGGGWALRIPQSYVSVAVLQVNDDGQAGFLDRLQQAQTIVLSRPSLATIIAREDLYPEERQKVPIEDVIKDARNRDIRVVPLPPVRRSSRGAASSFEIQFTYPDPAKAQKVTRGLTEQFVQRLPGIQVLAPPTLPGRPASQNRLAFPAAGFLAGALAGMLLAGVRRWPIVAASGVAAAAAALAIAYLVPDRWVLSAVVEAAHTQTVLDDAVLQRVIQHPGLDLYKNERARMPIAEVIRRMRERDLRVVPRVHSGRQLYVVTYEHHGDRYKAQAVMRELVAAIVEEGAARQQTIPVLSPGFLPMRPEGPNRLAILLGGVAAGLMAGIVVTRKRRLRMAAAGA